MPRRIAAACSSTAAALRKSQAGSARSATTSEARFIHIYRDPYVVFESTRRALRTVLRELALQDYKHNPIDDIVLEDVYRSLALEGYADARSRIAAYLDSIHDYRKTTNAFSGASVRRMTERWQPFVTCFGYRPPDRERRRA